MPTDRPARPSAIEVEISDTQSHLLIDHDRLIALIRQTLRAEGVHRATISVALVDDATIRALNVRHLGHDWPTDVISFPLSGPDEPDLAGELVVSAEMARTTALEVHADPFVELSLYVVHGLLHLQGYDDATPGGIAAIRRREGEILEAAGLVNSFSLVIQAEPGPDRSEREGVRWVR